ncbi:MAG: hybrid sensor histidine kinase/response regulator, partial [Anaerolinea sp.]|nr:hybrid sensor histidine kinase/response regulator [Anaerolinea sp.]
RTTLDLGDVVGESLRMLRPLVGSSVVVETDIDGTYPAIDADRVQVQQVILNLVANASEAMQGRGRITIGASRVYAARPQSGEPGEFAHLWVQDTGPGVPPEIRDHIFEPYFTTREFGGGTGLGLSIVHGIASAHGGWAEVSPSETGARLSVFFPAA